MSSFDFVQAEPRSPLSRGAIAALAVAFTTFLLLGGALLLRHVAASPEANLTLVLGPRTLRIPVAALAADASREPAPDRVEIALSWPGLGPAIKVVADGAGKPMAAPLAHTLLISLRAADDSPDPSVRPGLLYGRFLEPTVWNYPGDLLARRFRAGSPYAGEELVFLPPEGKAFAARCAVGEAGGDSRCTVAWRRRGVDIVVGFDRALLADAQRLREQIFTWFERAVR